MRCATWSGACARSESSRKDRTGSSDPVICSPTLGEGERTVGTPGMGDAIEGVAHHIGYVVVKEVLR